MTLLLREKLQLCDVSLVSKSIAYRGLSFIVTVT